MLNVSCHMRTNQFALRSLMLIAVVFMPNIGFAQTFEVSGWIPYWRSEAGVQSALPNLDSFTEINPFMYTVRQDGSLNEAVPLTANEWVMLKAKAKEKNVRFIPTIMWANPDAIDDVLRNPSKRQAHVRAIAQAVYAHTMDGIDIDYEGKYARTKDYFSLFLKELNEAIGYDKWVMCTIEARTPLDSRFASPADIPEDIEYANDFSAINRSCDRVRIMSYDQGRFDLKLNAANAHPYAPVADKAWVEKVMVLAAKEIDAGKLVVGVPTYGYEYDMFLALDGSGKTEYSRLWSFNPGYVTEITSKLGNIQPVRNSSGELVVTYPASQSPDGIIPLPQATRVMSWSDSQAIQEKVDLAKRLGFRGIALFKVDGGQDPALWNVTTQHPGGKLLAKVSTLVASNPPPPTPSPETPSAPSSGALAIPSRNLEYGARNEEVRALQKYLNAKGFTIVAVGGGSPGNETTFFGPATKRALIKFQQAHSVKPAAGYFGPLTRAKFRSLL